jgi:hypothetical protein
MGGVIQRVAGRLAIFILGWLEGQAALQESAVSIAALDGLLIGIGCDRAIQILENEGVFILQVC